MPVHVRCLTLCSTVIVKNERKASRRPRAARLESRAGQLSTFKSGLACVRFVRASRNSALTPRRVNAQLGFAYNRAAPPPPSRERALSPAFSTINSYDLSAIVSAIRPRPRARETAAARDIDFEFGNYCALAIVFLLAARSYVEKVESTNVARFRAKTRPLN